MIFNPNSGFSGGGLEGLRIESRYGSLNSAGEFLLAENMTEIEFKQKFIAYFCVRFGTSNNTNHDQLPYGDREKYAHLTSSLDLTVSDNNNYQAFRFSGSDVYCTTLATTASPTSYQMTVVVLYKDA